MRKAQTRTVKVKEKNRKILSVLLVVFLIAFLMRFEVVAKIIAPVLNTTPEKIMEVSKIVMWSALGIALIMLGAFVSLAFVSAAFIIAGILILISQLVKIYNMNSADGTGKISGTGKIIFPEL